MIAYVDTSVLLRILFMAPHALPEWKELTVLIGSPLLRVEGYRAIDRLRLTGEIAPQDLSQKRRELQIVLDRFNYVQLDDVVLTRAAEPLPLPLRTLDAIHLASAMIHRERSHEPILMATHDTALAKAARAMHFDVIGAA